MKKIVLSLLIYLTYCQCAGALTSNLEESLREQEAITFALGMNPSFKDVIPSNEFIIDIKRRTKNLDFSKAGTVRYLIQTVSPKTIEESFFSSVDMGDFENRRRRHPHRMNPTPEENVIKTYEALLTIAPHIGAGAPSITVDDIIPLINQNNQLETSVITGEDEIVITQYSFF